MDSISQIVHNNLQWIDISEKGKDEFNFVKKGFSFLDIDIEECFTDTKHSEIFVRNNYIYFEILFPIYNKKTQLIDHSEVNFFIKDNTLLTVRSNDLFPLTDLFNSIEISSDLKKELFQGNPVVLLTSILNALLDHCFPMLNHINEDVVLLEKTIFAEKQKTTTEKILRMRWNIINFRRIIQSYKNIIEKLISNGNHLFSMSRLKIHYDNLLEKTKDIWNTLETEKDSISALQQTNESLIAFQLNDIMKTLAIISAIIMPASLITSLFGVNAKIPYITTDPAFFVIIGMCIFLIAAFMIYFKKKKWF